MSGPERPARLVPLPPDELDEAQSALYDAISGGRRALGPQRFRLRHVDGSLTGPFDAMLRHPAVGSRLSALGEALRYEGVLSDRAREIAILVVGSTRQAAYEWYAHAPIARAVGLSEEELDRIREGAPAPFADPTEAAVYAGSRALLAHAPIDDELFEMLTTSLMTAGVVELVILVGYYDLLASLLAVFDVGVPG